KLSPNNGGRRQDRLCARGEARQALPDQRRPTRREPQLRYRAPFPANAAMPYRSLLREIAKQLRDEERIPLGVPIEKREKLTSHLLGMKRRLEPLLHVVARETGKDDLARILVTAEGLAIMRRVEGRVRPMREAEEHAIGFDLRRHVLEHVPRRGVSVLHLVEHEHEGPLRGDPAKIIRQLGEETVVTPRLWRLLRLIAAGQYGLHVPELVP